MEEIKIVPNLVFPVTSIFVSNAKVSASMEIFANFNISYNSSLPKIKKKVHVYVAISPQRYTCTILSAASNFVSNARNTLSLSAWISKD